MSYFILITAAFFFGMFYRNLFLGVANFWKISTEHQTKLTVQKAQIPVSIVIAYRNEENRLSELCGSLLRLTYPEHLIEFIWIDDHSEDRSTELIKEKLGSIFKNQRLLFNPETGKKAAIRHGIEAAKNDIILLTDGDVVLPEKWIEGMLTNLNKDINAVCGPVKFKEDRRFFERWLQLDFVALICTGAAYIEMGKPVMANGANLLVKKSAYLSAMKNMAGKEYASGDDVFLIQSLHPGSIAFCYLKETIVETYSPVNLKAFFSQRIRWASKAGAYKLKESKVLSIFVFLFHLLLLLTLGLLFINDLFVPVFLTLFLFKYFTDRILFKRVLPFFSIRFSESDLLKSEFMQIMYIPLVGLLSTGYKVKWKGRNLKLNP